MPSPLLPLDPTLEAMGYQLPDFTRTPDADWVSRFEAAMAAEWAALEQLTAQSSPPELDLIARWEGAGADTTAVANAFWTLKEADTNPARDEVEAVVAPQLARHADRILLDRRLYDKLVQLQDRIDAGEVIADEQDRWWLSEHRRSFVRAGIELNAPDQQRLKEINAAIAELETEYSQLVVKGRLGAGVAVDDLAALAGLNPDQIDDARRVAGEQGHDGWLIELVNTTRQPLLAQLDDRTTRQRVFEASLGRGQAGEWDVRATILRLANLRAEKAQLLGFPHYGAYIADDGCAKTTEAIMSLLN
ncbi:MAG: M3 family metallopeptidase, partial [Propionibacteriaceae bacterium]|nr:M3 family metallopeptidase [Propionibacteriaceae bacterium]